MWKDDQKSDVFKTAKTMVKLIRILVMSIA